MLPTFPSIFVKSHGIWLIFIVPKGVLLILAYWLEFRGALHHQRMTLLISKVNKKINLFLNEDCLQKDRSTVIPGNVLCFK